MLKRLVCATACVLTLAATSQAAWVPTGQTKFLPHPLVKVTGVPGQSITLQATLRYELKDSRTPAVTKWEPLKAKAVEWAISLDGVIGIEVLYPSTTDGEGKATLKGQSIPDWVKPGTGGHYIAYFSGGCVQGVSLRSCSERGTIEVVPERWAPTGQTRLLPRPLPMVTGAPGQSVTFQATLWYEVRGTHVPGVTKWEPLKSKTVEWAVAVEGVISVQVLYPSKTDDQGKATLNWKIPNGAKPGAKGHYTAYFNGGSVQGVSLKSRSSGQGAIVVVKK